MSDCSHNALTFVGYIRSKPKKMIPRWAFLKERRITKFKERLKERNLVCICVWYLGGSEISCTFETLTDYWSSKSFGRVSDRWN